MYVNKATSWTISGTANISKITNQYATVNIQGGNIGIIDNSSGSTVIITGGTIESTTDTTISNRGTLRIQGGTIRSNNKYAIYNGGTVTITGGTIVATGTQAAVVNEGTMTIGTEGGGVDTTTPVMQGATFGIESLTDFSFYDGIAKGKTRGISDATTPYASIPRLSAIYKARYI